MTWITQKELEVLSVFEAGGNENVLMEWRQVPGAKSLRVSAATHPRKRELSVDENLTAGEAQFYTDHLMSDGLITGTKGMDRAWVIGRLSSSGHERLDYLRSTGGKRRGRGLSSAWSTWREKLLWPIVATVVAAIILAFIGV